MTESKDETTIEPPSDDDLRAMGLEPRQAWIRSEATGKALRNKHSREKAAAQGRRQISIAVPDQARETVRTICQQLCAEELSTADLTELLQRAERQQSRTLGAPESVTRETAPRETRAIKRQTLMLTGASGAALAAGIALALIWG
jgi:FlaA1/EpsC-like NDP-sugar epimerase